MADDVEPTEAEDRDDDALLEELRAQPGPFDDVPPAVLESARRTFSERPSDDELARLAYDPLVDGDNRP